MNPKDAIATLINSVERTFSDEGMPEDLARAIQTLAGDVFPAAAGTRSLSSHARGRGRTHPRARTLIIARERLLVFARHTKKWEAAHYELIDGSRMWVRDDMSTICPIGREIATHPMPPKPA